MTTLTRRRSGRISSVGLIVTTSGHGDPVVHAIAPYAITTTAACGAGSGGLQIFPLALLLRIGRPCRRCWVTDPRLVDPYATTPHPYTRDACLELGASA